MSPALPAFVTATKAGLNRVAKTFPKLQNQELSGDSIPAGDQNGGRATPTHLHKDIVIAALQSGGKTRVCEMPLAHTIDGCPRYAEAPKPAETKIPGWSAVRSDDGGDPKGSATVLRNENP